MSEWTKLSIKINGGTESAIEVPAHMSCVEKLKAAYESAENVRSVEVKEITDEEYEKLMKEEFNRMRM